MPFYAANAVPITSGYSGRATFPSQGWFKPPFRKMDVFSNGTDAIFQPLEEESGWIFDRSQEGLLPMGFNSVEFDTPIVAVRFRVWEDTLLAPSGTVHVRLLS